MGRDSGHRTTNKNLDKQSERAEIYRAESKWSKNDKIKKDLHGVLSKKKKN